MKRFPISKGMNLNFYSKFPVKTATGIKTSMDLEVVVRCDSLYIDSTAEPFYGIKQITVHTRKIISDGGILDLRVSNYFIQVYTVKNARNRQNNNAF